MKFIIFVGDGMADEPLKELGNKTPLQVADIPNINSLVKKSKLGKTKTILEGMPAGSEIAFLSLFGYEPKKCFTGRGALEAPGLGIELKPNEIAFRCNLITEKRGILKDYSADHISNEESWELILFINERLGNDDIKFFPGVQYRHLMVLNSDKYSCDVISYPPHDHLGEPFENFLLKEKNPMAKKTVEIINKMILDSKKLLENHPVNIKRKNNNKNMANMIWPWSSGKKPNIKTYQELYNIKGAVISAVDIVFGIGIYAGMAPIKVKGANGMPDTNYEGKANAAIEALKKYDYVLVHLEAPDEATHMGDAKLKVRTIEDFDKRLIGNVLKRLSEIDDKVRIAILPDHYTKIRTLTHSNEPVPVMIYDPDNNGDNIPEFNEKNAEKGSLGLIGGQGFVKILLGRN